MRFLNLLHSFQGFLAELLVDLLDEFFWYNLCNLLISVEYGSCSLFELPWHRFSFANHTAAFLYNLTIILVMIICRCQTGLASNIEQSCQFLRLNYGIVVHWVLYMLQ